MIYKEVLLVAMFLGLIIAQRKKDLTEEELSKLKEQTGIDPKEVSDDAIILSPPKLTEEDEGSKFIPDAYRCDACRSMAYHFVQKFSKAESKKKGSKLSYVEILENVEELCQDEFKECGVKNVLGKNYFSGPGLASARMSGMVDAGGVWTKRMQKLCQELVGEFEEDGIYAMWDDPDVSFEADLCTILFKLKKNSIFLSSFFYGYYCLYSVKTSQITL
ncbi:Marginal zone B- and B1-cell-specific protein [Bulinus truncatus]|nr:Marginal zone B- and B1-cell-specific protein [Bulinus truncatus]